MTWTVLGGSERGSSHVRDDLPNQDAYATWAEGPYAVVTVADGHGHHAHFRSGTGSRLAADLLLDRLRTAAPGLGTPETALAVVRDELAPAYVEAWVAAVLDDVRTRPFDTLEQSRLTGSSTQDLLLAYGSTILALVATPSVVVVLQLGDGDAVLVAPDGTCTQPLPRDPVLDGTRTSSLCQPDPLRSLRCVAVPAASVALGYVCTDGFGGPRVDRDGWWRQVGQELLERSAEHGWDWIAERLPGWLEEPAQYGGDDVTLAVLGRG